MAERRKRYIFDNPKNVRRVIYGLYLACALSFAADLFIHRHVEHPFEALFNFYSIYGFVGIVVLVLAAKQLRRIAMRKEDYYDD